MQPVPPAEVIVAKQYRYLSSDGSYYYVDTVRDMEFGNWHATISLSTDKGRYSDDAIRSLVDVCRDFVRTYENSDKVRDLPKSG